MRGWWLDYGCIGGIWDALIRVAPESVNFGVRKFLPPVCRPFFGSIVLSIISDEAEALEVVTMHYSEERPDRRLALALLDVRPR